VRSARDCGTPLRIRGSGTKDFYGGCRRANCSTRPLAGISSYEPTELVVTVRAGTPLAELEAALAEQGQCLPFEPPRFAGDTPEATAHGGTVGGMIAAGLSGPSRAAVGACATTCSAPRCSTAGARC
jgi:glycolate oxidase FAD binding subunit